MTAEDVDRVRARWLLRTGAGSAALTSTVEVTNIGGDELSLGALPSLSLPVTGEAAGAAVGPEELDLISGASEWCAENRWQRHPVRGYLPALSSIAHQLSAKGAYSARVLGSWSTGGALPTGVLAARDDSFALAWQLEHNGPWRWDLAEESAGLTLTLSGPTDADHQWLAVLRPGETFCTVPATVALGVGWQAALGELTKHRRLARRPHPDNERLTVIYTDYMNTLMGEPTAERLLSLVDAAAEAGAEAFSIDAGWYDTTMQGFAGWWDYVGEWQPSIVRFPNGITEVLDRIRERGWYPGSGSSAMWSVCAAPWLSSCPTTPSSAGADAGWPKPGAITWTCAIRPLGLTWTPRGSAGRGPGCRLFQVRLQHQPRTGHRRRWHQCRCGTAGPQPSPAGLAGRAAGPAPKFDY